MQRVYVENAPQFPKWEYIESTLYEATARQPMVVRHAYTRSFPDRFEGDTFSLPCSHGRIVLDYTIHCRRCKKCGNNYDHITLASIRTATEEITGSRVHVSLRQEIPQGVTFLDSEE